MNRASRVIECLLPYPEDSIERLTSMSHAFMDWLMLFRCLTFSSDAWRSMPSWPVAGVASSMSTTSGSFGKETEGLDMLVVFSRWIVFGPEGLRRCWEWDASAGAKVDCEESCNVRRRSGRSASSAGRSLSLSISISSRRGIREAVQAKQMPEEGWPRSWFDLQNKMR